MLTSKLNYLEHDALAEALKLFFSENENTSTTLSLHKLKCIDILKDKLLDIYCGSKDIDVKPSKFMYSPDDITKALNPKPKGEIRERPCPVQKARFLIWALEYTGHYKRPQDISEDHFFDSVKSFIYKGEKKQYRIKKSKSLEGVYLVKRLSFNNSFPGWVTVSRMWIWYDLDLKSLRYYTINRYPQTVNGKTLDRERITTGYIFKFQGNMLFLGDVDYSHLGETEGKDSVSHYPEIILAHAHGGDVKNIRGLILGNYPFLNLPVATSILISKELSLDDSNNNVKSHLDKYLSKKESNEDELIGLKKLSELDQQQQFIINTIEEKYSKMLTP